MEFIDDLFANNAEDGIINPEAIEEWLPDYLTPGNIVDIQQWNKLKLKVASITKEKVENAFLCLSFEQLGDKQVEIISKAISEAISENISNFGSQKADLTDENFGAILENDFVEELEKDDEELEEKDDSEINLTDIFS